jgi:archaellin
MRRFLISMFVIALIFAAVSCNSENRKTATSDDKIKQMDDGTIDLHIEKASCYHDSKNPSSNTAEWNIVVSKPGRYKVWLSSATIDTMDLSYKNSVKINFLDERLDVKPVGDKIVLNTNDVKYPYFRADSYMGTFYIQEAGEYSLQVISEKVVSQTDIVQSGPGIDHTKLLSVFLTPMTR